jgi:flagellar biosynthesis protein FliR
MTRIIGALLIAPVISRKEIPLSIKVGLTATLAFAMYDSVINNSINIINTNQWIYTFNLMTELLIGFIFGFVFNLYFDAVATIAQVAGIQAGQSSGAIFNPDISAPLNPLANMIIYFSYLIFVNLNGFFILFFLIAKSFEIIPITTFNFDMASLSLNFIYVFKEIFVYSLKLLMPFIGIMFVIDMLITLIAKILPQANMFFLFVPNKILVAVIVLNLMMVTYTSSETSYFNEKLYDFYDLLLLGK